MPSAKGKDHFILALYLLFKKRIGALKTSPVKEGITMCGIVGYAGNRDSSTVLVDGLKKLEYRGYDSAGIAVFEDNVIKVVKAKGRLEDLEEK